MKTINFKPIVKTCYNCKHASFQQGLFEGCLLCVDLHSSELVFFYSGYCDMFEINPTMSEFGNDELH